MIRFDVTCPVDDREEVCFSDQRSRNGDRFVSFPGGGYQIRSPGRECWFKLPPVPKSRRDLPKT